MGRRGQAEENSDRRFREALYRGLTGLRSALERQTGVLVSLERATTRIERHAAAEDLRRSSDELEESRRRRAEQRLAEETDPKPVGNVMFTATFAALRMLLVFLPEQHFERIPGGVRIVCKCRELHQVPNRNFHECSCGRLYVVTENTVKVLPLEQAVAA